MVYTEEELYIKETRRESDLQNRDTCDRYKKDQKTWELLERLNQNTKYDDPLTYADEIYIRLSSFCETYDFIFEQSFWLRKKRKSKLPLSKQAHGEVEFSENGPTWTLVTMCYEND